VEESFQGNRKYFHIKRLGGNLPLVNLTETELSALQMCRAFAEHLLGREVYQESTRALEKSLALLPGKQGLSSDLFASFKPGSIDYTPHQESIRNLIEAMERKKICRITYKSIMASGAKIFHIKPLKIFSHRETIYLHARLAREPSKAWKEPAFDPLLTIHRLKKVEITDRMFEFPRDYDFKEVFNQNFGIIKDEAFKVEAEFTGFAARYVAERVWNPDQKIRPIDDGKIVLTFEATSVPEVISWLLSFGEEAKLLSPVWLVEEVKIKSRYFH
jgi:predicted DNA-binding transcriptional regulator YafY